MIGNLVRIWIFKIEFQGNRDTFVVRFGLTLTKRKFSVYFQPIVESLNIEKKFPLENFDDRDRG